MSGKNIVNSEIFGITILKYRIQKNYLDPSWMQSEVDVRAALGKLLKTTKELKDATNKQNSDPHRGDRITVWITDLPG